MSKYDGDRNGISARAKRTPLPRLCRPVAQRFSRYFLTAASALLCLAANGFPAWAAPPKLTSLFPSGGQVGTTVAIEAKGTFDPWPVQIWVNRPGVEVRALEEKGKLSAAVAADALPGVYWVRLYNAEGAAPAWPFVVGLVAEVAEQEPNDLPAKAQAIDAPQAVVNGRLERRGDVDCFAVELSAGQTLVAEIESQRRLESPLDASLEIVSPQGFVLAHNDDDQGLDPRIVYTAPAAGKYLVRTYGFPAAPDSTIGLVGGDKFLYRLTLSTTGFIDRAWPLALGSESSPIEAVGWNIPSEARTPAPLLPPGGREALLAHPLLANTFVVPVEAHRSIVASPTADEPAGQPIELPVTISGRIAQAQRKQAYRFTAAAGENWLFRVESRQLGFPLDPVLELFDAAGKSLARVDDVGGNRDAEIAFATPADGEYRLTVADLHRRGGERFVYRLRAERPAPDFTLSLAAESYSVAAGADLEIPVAVERRHGFNQPIKISLVGLPEGVHTEPVVSPVEGEEAKAVKLAVKCDHPFAGPVQVVGQSEGDAPLERRATSPIAERTSRTDHPWLTVTKP